MTNTGRPGNEIPMTIRYKKLIKAWLRALGVEGFAKFLYHRSGIAGRIRASEQRRFHQKYGEIKRFEVNIYGLTLFFSTEDSYSKRWFYPRYDDGKIHEEPVTLLILENLKSSKCFVDVGTNLGWYTCLASKFMSDGVVYGFEMDSYFYALVQENLRINGCTNATISHAAVNDTPERVSYVRNSMHPSPRLRLASNAQGTESDHVISVQALTLDDFFKDKTLVPDVIKIDVEGAEIKVLRGMTRLMKGSKVKLFIEVHPKELMSFGSSGDEVVSFLLNSGYRVFEIEGMRKHGKGKRLRELSKESHLTYDIMLYAYR